MNQVQLDSMDNFIGIIFYLNGIVGSLSVFLTLKKKRNLNLFSYREQEKRKAKRRGVLSLAVLAGAGA